MSDYAEFGKVRACIWPIHNRELFKLLPMLFMAFLTAMIYEILRSMKESLIVTAAGSGAEVIPFLKVWVMLPTAILLTYTFIKLSHRYRSETVFYIVISGFLTFFLLFAFVCYPVRESLHLHGIADWMQSAFPSGAGGLIAMVRYWSFSIFYAMAECWGTICLLILFWGFANEITSVKEAARFYGIIALGSNLASIAAGKISYAMCHRTVNPNWLNGDAWHQSLILLTLTIVSAGLIIMVTFRWFNLKVVSRLDLPTNHRNKKLDKLESKPSLKESFTYLLKSKYLINIATVVIAYNLFINLVEVLWKSQVKELYPNPNDYTSYMSNVTFATGIIATMMALIVSGNMIRKFGWTAAAMVTPVILVVTSIAFFGFYLYPGAALALGTSPIVMVVLFGAIQNSFSRASKYTIFDETKEICFIPLSREMRVKGKASIDGIASRLGKSGGSLIYHVMFMTVGTLSASAPYIGVILLFLLAGWMITLRTLGRRFAEVVGTQAEPVDSPILTEQAQTA